jgi:anti-anti-sigma factor
MNLETSVYGDLPVIKILGEVGHYSGPTLADTMDRTVSAGFAHVALDLSDCPYMDSAGIGTLLSRPSMSASISVALIGHEHMAVWQLGVVHADDSVRPGNGGTGAELRDQITVLGDLDHRVVEGRQGGQQDLRQRRRPASMRPPY